MTDLSPVAFGRVGSNPTRGTKHMVHPSNWLGYRPFTAKIWVRVPYALQRPVF